MLLLNTGKEEQKGSRSRKGNMKRKTPSFKRTQKERNEENIWLDSFKVVKKGVRGLEVMDCPLVKK